MSSTNMIETNNTLNSNRTATTTNNTTTTTTTASTATSTVAPTAVSVATATAAPMATTPTTTGVVPPTALATSTATKPINNAANNNTNTNGSLSDSLTSTDGQRTPNVENLSRTNLYIRGLTSNTSDQDLYNMCARFGHIFSTKAILDKATGCCRGYGFVEFTTPQSAELAVQELTKSGVQAQMARISPLYSSSQNQHHHQNHHNPHHNQHHHHHNQHQHHHHHHPHHQHHHHHNSGNNGGGGLGGGNSNNHHNYNNNNNNTQQHNQNSSSSSSNNHNNSHNADPTNLYIANLPPNMSEQELENLLSAYGPVVSTRILRDESNVPRGVGFARMESRDKCQEIIEKLNGKPCKGWKEPLLVKFADGGNRKRHHHNNNHHHQQHKVHQDDSRWREGSNSSGLSNLSSFDQQGNISHSNQLSDLAMVSTLSYPRIQTGFPPTMAPGSGYPATLGPPTSAPQWIHPGGPGQPWNVIPQQMIQAGGLAPSNQAAALHYGHIPQLTSQMQGLQLAPPGAPVGGYLPPHHQWPGLWPAIPQQPQPASVRIAAPMQHPPQPPSHQQQSQPPVPQPQQSPQVPTNVQRPPNQQQQPPVADNKLQVSMPL